MIKTVTNGADEFVIDWIAEGERREASVIVVSEEEPRTATLPDIDLARIKYRGRPIWV